jgi:hypothetical protein
MARISQEEKKQAIKFRVTLEVILRDALDLSL